MTQKDISLHLGKVMFSFNDSKGYVITFGHSDVILKGWVFFGMMNCSVISDNLLSYNCVELVFVCA